MHFCCPILTPAIADLPQNGAGGVLLLGGVPLGGQVQSEALAHVGDEASLVGNTAEHVGRVTVGGHGGGHAGQQGSSTGDGRQGGAAGLRGKQRMQRGVDLIAALVACAT